MAGFPRTVAFLLLLPVVLLASACKDEDRKSEAPAFMSIGDFAVTRKPTHIEVRDGAGRTLALVPRGAEAPPGFAPSMVVRVPVRRVVAYGAFEVGILKALGEIDTVVGLTAPRKKWFIPEIRKGFDEGRIAFIGDSRNVDYERIKEQHPDLITTWDPSIVPMMDTLGIPVVVTATPVATCLNTRIRLVQFLAPFFGRDREAEAYYQRVKTALDAIHATTRGLPKPKVMWGDIFEKRVLVEPGNAWVAQLVGLAQSDYRFDDVYGTSCIEISTERFLYSGNDADIYFTYRTPDRGATSKAALVRTNPLLARVKPLQPGGRTYAPLPHYSQSSDRLDEILTEISAILHPSAYPGHRLGFFMELPDTDPAPAKENPS